MSAPGGASDLSLPLANRSRRLPVGHGSTEVHRPNAGWSLLLWPPLLVASVLLLLPQAVFVWMSLHGSVAPGTLSDTPSFVNYSRVLTEGFYLKSAWLTLWISAVATLACLLIGTPVAYFLASLNRGIASVLVLVLLVSSFVTIVIKVLGLSLLIGREGVINRALLTVGLVDTPVQMLNNEIGVLIGLVQYTLPLLIMLMFSAIQTVPISLEEAAQVHGATWLSAIRRVVLPILWPAILSSGLIVFNLNMGAFTSAVLLGGGRVLTLPVLIQRQFLLDIDYGTGAAVSTLLLLFVFLLNLVAAAFARPRSREAGVAHRLEKP